MLPPITPKQCSVQQLASLIKNNDYVVLMVDGIQILITIGQRCEKTVIYTLQTAERVAFGEVRTR